MPKPVPGATCKFGVHTSGLAGPRDRWELTLAGDRNVFAKK